MRNGGRISDLADSVRKRRERIERARREGERTIGQNLALIGALGWLVVIPTLLFMFAGLWIDRREGTGIFWTASLLAVGVVLGAWLAWRRMHEA